ncbi:hypothetical protein KC356_g224 [Hortaea werneckii]|nr:hypothetical protein KC356_g224 [Hortaea werneckii]
MLEGTLGLVICTNLGFSMMTPSSSSSSSITSSSCTSSSAGAFLPPTGFLLTLLLRLGALPRYPAASTPSMPPTGPPTPAVPPSIFSRSSRSFLRLSPLKLHLKPIHKPLSIQNPLHMFLLEQPFFSLLLCPIPLDIFTAHLSRVARRNVLRVPQHETLDFGELGFESFALTSLEAICSKFDLRFHLIPFSYCRVGDDLSIKFWTVKFRDCFSSASTEFALDRFDDLNWVVQVLAFSFHRVRHRTSFTFEQVLIVDRLIRPVSFDLFVDDFVLKLLHLAHDPLEPACYELRPDVATELEVLLGGVHDRVDEEERRDSVFHE